MKLYMFRTIPLSIIRGFSLHTQQWYTSYRFVDSFRAVSGWMLILLLLESCLQTCMTYTIAVCTVNNSWWWTEALSETCRVSFQNKFEKLVHLFGFIIRICHDARSHELKRTEKNEVGRHVVYIRIEERHIQSISAKTWGKRPFWRRWLGLENNIKMCFQEVRWMQGLDCYGLG
jgi:hypothetical protein